jgi:hypothetical protein
VPSNQLHMMVIPVHVTFGPLSQMDVNIRISAKVKDQYGHRCSAQDQQNGQSGEGGKGYPPRKIQPNM